MSPPAATALIAAAAVAGLTPGRCLRCGSYPIPELEDTALSIHMGIGVSGMHAFRVGLPERWELLVYGGALQQAGH